MFFHSFVFGGFSFLSFLPFLPSFFSKFFRFKDGRRFFSVPFNSELQIDDGHFDPSLVETVARVVRSDTDDLVQDQAEFQEGQLDLKLGVSPDLIKSKQGTRMGLSREEELGLAIDSCKEMILQSCEHSPQRRQLVAALVQYRMQLQQIKEGITDPTRRLAGHKFRVQDRTKRNSYCEKCMGVIWRPIQQWFRCSVCGYRSHAKCLDLITRRCAGLRVKENPEYELRICPEKGLAEQNYVCFERGCSNKIGFNGEIGVGEARQCDYDGRFYCIQCHWNDTMIIPARVVHNWQFTPFHVSRNNKQFLEIMHRKPVLPIEKLNPALFNFIEELRVIKKARSDILLMKCYFICCKNARKLRILWHLKRHQHFVEGTELYSLKDILHLHTNRLLPELRGIMKIFYNHIRIECEICRGNGFICELCSDKQIIYPFDDYVAHCAKCYALFHRRCFDRVSKNCPRCERRRRRTLSANEGEPFLEEENIACNIASDYNAALNPFENEGERQEYDKELNPFEGDD